MANRQRRPQYHDYQAPNLYRAGCSLRRSYLTGAADTAEEAAMRQMLAHVDKPA